MNPDIEGGWRILSIFPDTEALVIKKLRERFQESGDALLMNCLISIEKPKPQEKYTGNLIVVNRNGGGLNDNGYNRDDIFTLQIWGYNFSDVARITTLAEGLFQTLYGDGIASCTIDEPQVRVAVEGEAFLRYFTGNVLVTSSSL